MLQCEIVTPESKLYSQEVEFVVLPGSEGEMGIYAKHEPIVTTLKSGTVRVTPGEGAEMARFAVMGGYAQIEAEQVIILADRAAAVDELSVESLRETVAGLKEQLAALADDDPVRAGMQNDLEWNELLVHCVSQEG